MSIMTPSLMSATRRIGRQRRLVTGLVITLVVALIAIIGPWLAPYGENDILSILLTPRARTAISS